MQESHLHHQRDRENQEPLRGLAYSLVGLTHSETSHGIRLCSYLTRRGIAMLLLRSFPQ
jgi:hypothetical protein